uniref:ubiquitinyl hydrolase 1 n=1 Tax=Arion vulgaris TaxID=1028688 RepID=A0A0B7BKC8_9EUPU
MKYDLEDSRSINWFPHAVELFPVCVSKDGNCLLHAASVAVWGVEDSQNTLRDLMLMTVKNNHNFKKRWWSQLMRNLQSLEINQPEVLNREWDDVIRSISDLGSSSLSIAVPHRFLEGIHIYILANILRRPIIIVTNGPARSLSGFELQENHISGLYLPLEWAPIECCKTPIILGYSFSHFCPLISKSHPYSKTSSQGKKKPFCFLLSIAT